MIPVACPLIGEAEKAAVLQALSSGQLAQGDQVAEFERRFAALCQVREAVAVSSGTAALFLSLLAHGVGPGDEVITTAFSFAATANAIILAGATPVFVDIEADSYTIDPEQVKAALTSRTKALLPVHLYGNPCHMERLLQLAEAHHIAIIEDACQTHAASIHGTPVGSFGTGCFSFYATKNMTTGEGGMVTTNDPEIAERVRLLCSHGQKQRYLHTELGYNFRMTDLQGALGIAQLASLVRFTEQRIANAAFLSERLRAAIETPVVRPGYRHVYHQYTVRVPENRDKWISHLRERGVGAAVHYPLAIYQQPCYQDHPELFRIVSTTSDAGVLPQTERAAQQVLSLPVHPALSRGDLELVAREVLALCR